MIEFTISQAWAVILSVCGGIVTISAAVSVGFKIRNHFRNPNLKQDEQIAMLWRKINGLEDDLIKMKSEFLQFFKNDKQRLDAIEQGNRVTQQAILALLKHGLDGNDVQSMKKAQENLEQFLLSK